MSRIMRSLLICVAVGLAILSAKWLSGSLVPSASAEGTSYAAIEAESDLQVAAATARAGRSPNSWMEHERAANACLDRGRLCDRWDDYASAESHLVRAFEIAPPGAGPFLSRARFNFTMHRFNQVEGDLARAESQPFLSPYIRAEIRALRADAQLERGSVEPALADYRRAVDTQRDFSNLARLAGGLEKNGALQEADAMFAEASKALPQSAIRERAWVSLQRGLVALKAEDLKTAIQHYRDAQALLPGWWLAQEHIAEALCLQGEDDQALAIYQEVLARTNDPEFMDAIARIYRKRGDESNAQHWIALAKAGHAARLARFPEAAAKHAAQHVRDFGEIVPLQPTEAPLASGSLPHS